MWNDAVITKDGIDLLSRWTSGAKLVVTSARIGTGTTSHANLENLHDVVGYAFNADVTIQNRFSGGFPVLNVAVKPQIISANMRQIGIFAMLESEDDPALSLNETLIAIYQDENGVDIPTSITMPEFRYYFRAVIAMEAKGEITVIMNSDIYMERTVYDADGDGIVDIAKHANTAEAATTARNAENINGYNAASLMRSDGGTWNGSANIILKADGEGQEWSFDIQKNGHSGTYFNIWEDTKNILFKVDADSGKVSAPYGFIGNLEGTATNAQNSDYASNAGHSETSGTANSALYANSAETAHSASYADGAGTANNASYADSAGTVSPGAIGQDQMNSDFLNEIRNYGTVYTDSIETLGVIAHTFGKVTCVRLAPNLYDVTIVGTTLTNEGTKLMNDEFRWISCSVIAGLCGRTKIETIRGSYFPYCEILNDDDKGYGATSGLDYQSQTIQIGRFYAHNPMESGGYPLSMLHSGNFCLKMLVTMS